MSKVGFILSFIGFVLIFLILFVLPNPFDLDVVDENDDISLLKQRIIDLEYEVDRLEMINSDYYELFISCNELLYEED